jgi:IS1 family transposase
MAALRYLSRSISALQPGRHNRVDREAVIGEPEQISTIYVERQNLTLRMGSKRFVRLSNGFSKKIDCHLAAVSLYVPFYNLCRTHEALRMIPDNGSRDR